MSKALVLKQNSPKIRQKIQDAGISVCICAGFKGSKWLDYHIGLDAPFEVHGIGYDSEDMPGEDSIALFLHETEVIECKDVEEFIQKIKEDRNDNTGL